MHTATKSSRINISKEGKTKHIAKILSKHIKVGNVVFFKGALGVGKTTFIRHLINYLQIRFNTLNLLIYFLWIYIQTDSNQDFLLKRIVDIEVVINRHFELIKETLRENFK